MADYRTSLGSACGTLSAPMSSGESKAELTGAQLRHLVAELRHL